MKSLILFGDSLFGRFSKDRIVQLESELTRFRVFNFAAGGWDSRDILDRADFVSRNEADIIILSLGANDAAPWKQVPIHEFSQNLIGIFNALKKSTIYYFPPPLVNEKKELGDSIRLNKEMKKYVDVAKNVCEREEVKFIDSWKAFKPLLDGNKDYHAEDGVHLNDFGFDVMIKCISKSVNENLSVRK